MAGVPSSNIKSLANDKSVFLIDPSADNCFIENPKNRHMPRTFWQLEDEGIVVE